MIIFFTLYLLRLLRKLSVKWFLCGLFLFGVVISMKKEIGAKNCPKYFEIREYAL